jgi:hypothetical protein
MIYNEPLDLDYCQEILCDDRAWIFIYILYETALCVDTYENTETKTDCINLEENLESKIN